jgi:hypothetical protein
VAREAPSGRAMRSRAVRKRNSLTTTSLRRCDKRERAVTVEGATAVPRGSSLAGRRVAGRRPWNQRVTFRYSTGRHPCSQASPVRDRKVSLFGRLLLRRGRRRAPRGPTTPPGSASLFRLRAASGLSCRLPAPSTPVRTRRARPAGCAAPRRFASRAGSCSAPTRRFASRAGRGPTTPPGSASLFRLRAAGPPCSPFPRVPPAPGLLFRLPGGRRRRIMSSPGRPEQLPARPAGAASPSAAPAGAARPRRDVVPVNEQQVQQIERFMRANCRRIRSDRGSSSRDAPSSAASTSSAGGCSRPTTRRPTAPGRT